MHIQTAKDWEKRLSKIDNQNAKDNAIYTKQMRLRASVIDLRDKTIALVLASGLSLKAIEEMGGPNATTLAKWRDGIVIIPNMSSIRSCLNVLGYDLGIVKIGDK